MAFLQAWLNSYLNRETPVAHLDMQRLIEKLAQNQPLSALEREFLRQVCDRLYRTAELDYLTQRKTPQ